MAEMNMSRQEFVKAIETMKEAELAELSRELHSQYAKVNLRRVSAEGGSMEDMELSREIGARFTLVDRRLRWLRLRPLLAVGGVAYGIFLLARLR